MITINFKTILAITFALLSLTQATQANEPHSILGTQQFAYYGKTGKVTASAPGFLVDQLPQSASEKAQDMYKYGKKLFEKVQTKLGDDAKCTTIFMSYSDRETTSPVAKPNAPRTYKEGLMIQVRQQCPTKLLVSVDMIYGIIETEKDQCMVSKRVSRSKEEVQGVCDLQDYLADAKVKTDLETTIYTYLKLN